MACILELCKHIVTLPLLLNSVRSGYTIHVVLFLQMIGMANQSRNCKWWIQYIFSTTKRLGASRKITILSRWDGRSIATFAAPLSDDINYLVMRKAAAYQRNSHLLWKCGPSHGMRLFWKDIWIKFLSLQCGAVLNCRDRMGSDCVVRALWWW